MPQMFAAELPKPSLPKMPKVNLWGNEAVSAWLDIPGVEIAIEATFVHGVDLEALPPDERLLPLAINLDEEGRRTAQVGRQIQTEWFESKLHPSNLCCISRSAFEIIWSDNRNLTSGVVFALQILGSGLVQVSGKQVLPGSLVPLLPGVRVTLGSQAAGEILPLITFAVHFKLGPSAASPAKPPCFSSEPTARPPVGTWWAMCTYAKGLSAEDLKALPPQHVGFVAKGGAEATPTVIGRQEQPEVFEALMRGALDMCTLISRSHLKLEPIVTEEVDHRQERLRVTNLSPNPLLIDELTPLPRGESALLRDKQTIGLTMQGFVPFLTFRVVAPSGGDGGSSKMLALTSVSLDEMSANECQEQNVRLPEKSGLSLSNHADSFGTASEAAPSDEAVLAVAVTTAESKATGGAGCEGARALGDAAIAAAHDRLTEACSSGKTVAARRGEDDTSSGRDMIVTDAKVDGEEILSQTPLVAARMEAEEMVTGAHASVDDLASGMDVSILPPKGTPLCGCLIKPWKKGGS